MKAIRITGPGMMEVADVAMPEMGAGDVLLKIRYVGFCGSDLNTFRGGNSMVTYPRIPGHEISATIEAKGGDVPDTLQIGQVVTVNPYTNCGYCDSCRNGRVNACENNETLGVQRNGAMTEYASVPWQKIIPADGLRLQDVALVEPLSVGFHAVDRGQVTDSDTVMVIGCGMVGLGAVVRSVKRGAKVIAADLDDDKLNLAKRLGATYTYNTSTEWKDLPTPSVVIEAVGAAPTYQLAINRVGFTGRVVCIGYAKSDVMLNTSLFVKKELDVRGSRNATPKDFEAAIDYLRKLGGGKWCNDEKVKGCNGEMVKGCNDEKGADCFISALVTPEQAFEAMKQWDSNPGKIFRIIVEL